MAVCSPGRIYAAGNLYGNLCEYRLTGTAGSSHDFVCMGLLSERRLDMEKTVYSLQWEWLYVHCLIIMHMAGYSAAFFLLFTVLLCRRCFFTESSFPFQQRSSDRSSYFSSLRLVVHPQRSFV